MAIQRSYHRTMIFRRLPWPWPTPLAHWNYEVLKVPTERDPETPPRDIRLDHGFKWRCILLEKPRTDGNKVYQDFT